VYRNMFGAPGSNDSTRSPPPRPRNILHPPTVPASFSAARQLKF